MSMAIFLFTSVELTCRGLCYDSSLLVRFSTAVPKGEHRIALLCPAGTEEAIWAAESLCRQNFGFFDRGSVYMTPGLLATGGVCLSQRGNDLCTEVSRAH